MRSMASLSSPSLTQCSRFAERSSSGAASSFSAITAISMPWLRAPSRTRNGNRPLPAIRPHPAVLVSALAMNAYRLALLHNSAFRRLDEANQLLHVFGIAQRFAHFRERLAGVHLRARQQTKRARQNLHALLGKSFALEPNGVDSVAFRFTFGHHARKATASTPLGSSAKDFPRSA